jgi:hypothetical protein
MYLPGKITFPKLLCSARCRLPAERVGSRPEFSDIGYVEVTQIFGECTNHSSLASGLRADLIAQIRVFACIYASAS